MLKLTWLSWGKHCNVVLMLKLTTTTGVYDNETFQYIQPRYTLGILTIDRLIDHSH